MTTDNVKRLSELDRKIVDATQSLKFATSFRLALVHPARSAVDYLDGIVIQLEERLLMLEAKRGKVLKAD